MPAYLATVEWDEGCTGDVYFVKHAIEARRAVCDHWQDGELGGATVRRMRHLDCYEETGVVPMIEMIYMGWWAECYHCGMKMTADEQYDDDDNEFIMDIEKIVGTFNGPSFCCQECSDIYYARGQAAKGLREKQRRELESIALSRFGSKDISFPEHDSNWKWNINVSWDGEKPWVTEGCIPFNIPGAENCEVSIHIKRKSPMAKPETWYTYHPDAEEAFVDFFKEKTGRLLTKQADPNKFSNTKR